MKIKNKLNVAILGCSGLVGQSIVTSLHHHPWFQINSLHGYSTIGKKYQEIYTGNLSRILDESILRMRIQPVSELKKENTDLIFSALPTSPARIIEAKYAEYIPVISTASAYRYEADTPILLPIVNGEHAQLLKKQQHQRHWEGFICPGPNCTTVGLAIALFPIYRKLGLKNIHLVSMQAISGAGHTGIHAFEIQDNIIPYIAQEETKVKAEIKKIWADVDYEKPQQTFLTKPKFLIDAKCNRVPILQGHTLSIFFETKQPTNLKEIREILTTFRGNGSELDLPNCPTHPIHLFDANQVDRPQPRLEFQERASYTLKNHPGMQTYIGRLELSCFENGFKMTVLSHNTELGAGRGAVLNAEYLYKTGYLAKRRDTFD